MLPTRIKNTHRSGRWMLWVFGALVAFLGLIMVLGGVRLAMLGGSWYYVLAGVGLLFVGGQLVRRRRSGAWGFAVVFLGTVLWSVWEVGFDYWQWVPRLGLLLLLAIFLALLLPRLDKRFSQRMSGTLAGVLALVFVAAIALAFIPHGTIIAESTSAGKVTEQSVAAADWRHYGRTPNGTRYAPFNQINKDNVDQLEVAWSFRTGEVPVAGAEDQNTPMQVGDTLYACTAHNKVFALDVDTGEQRWAFDPQAQNRVFARCRGLGYYETQELSGADTGPEGKCTRRVMLTTVDARLIALNAQTGAPCSGFGAEGTVDLTQGMGEVLPGFYFQTSAPTVVRDLVVIGGWVFDNRMTDEPSGVVRAFSARTGELAWAWDVGKPDVGALPPEQQVYTRGTPNVWTTPAFDEELGLIYLPTGNSTPDFWGAHRTEVAEEYSVALVAVDIETGRERWKYQIVHHDLWDYDLASQPALHDIPDDNGGTTPALIQATKRGQIFGAPGTGALLEVKVLP